ncbi:hypothetical protein RLTM_04924 [Thermus parvatiensis]|uniref:Uncharacterized protein n=1 Tax=Thermus parvatiensis TaxID=456163 RepID=H7GG10_9DEIN|nr:hypothetical protein RLTM_04924 [Thermus parvatiensis]
MVPLPQGEEGLVGARRFQEKGLLLEEGFLPVPPEKEVAGSIQPFHPEGKPRPFPFGKKPGHHEGALGGRGPAGV